MTFAGPSVAQRNAEALKLFPLQHPPTYHDGEQSRDHGQNDIHDRAEVAQPVGQREHNHVGDEHEEKNDVIGRVMESPVFTRQDGRPFDPNDLRRQIFYKVLSLAGMRRVRFHDLRHRFASLLIGQGENLVYIKDQLGHASIQMTVDTYGHLIPSSNRIAVDKLDHMASGETPAESGSKTVAGDHRTEANYA